MTESILQFLKSQKAATIACVDEQNRPYCFSCFFAFDGSSHLLYFKSSYSSHHAQLLLRNPVVSGTVLPDKLNPLAVQGLQFTGTVLHPDAPADARATGEYYKKFPLALALPGDVWTLRLDSVKMTDSSKIFGKKTLWKREEEPS
ncbi:pyridoxamine 5'-phosphate oxidase family protein [Paraflavisolibacter sp. H34]|uniref:pyridoxamine 5'-phosphate oxidase family protein n=1 Tax=Huijunlia imazamoxiresistens TaxID=3127457 RepID=UPI003018ABA3